MSCTDEMFYVGIMSSGGREGGEDGFMAAMRVNVGGRKINSFHPPPQLFFISLYSACLVILNTREWHRVLLF